MRETRGTETRTLPVTLTTDELLARGDGLARAHRAVRDEQAKQKAVREEMKQRLEDLAKVHPQTINRIEKGHTTPDVATVQRLAEALGVPVSRLFEGAPSQPAA